MTRNYNSSLTTIVYITITKVEMKIILYDINNEVRLSRLCLVTELLKPKNV